MLVHFRDESARPLIHITFSNYCMNHETFAHFQMLPFIVCGLSWTNRV